MKFFTLVILLTSLNSFAGDEFKDVFLLESQRSGLNGCMIKKAVEITSMTGDDYLTGGHFSHEDQTLPFNLLFNNFITQNSATQKRKLYKVVLKSLSNTGWTFFVEGREIGYMTKLMDSAAELRLDKSGELIGTLDLSDCNI